MGRIITNILLLFCFVSAQAQPIAMFHAHNQMPAAMLLLDTYTGAYLAYSVRKINSSYTGSAMRVRRSSDNTEQDIGFTSSGDLNESTLLAFVGAGSGFVSVWYDQSGNGRNATQTTASAQPRIVNAGVVDKKSGKPALFFNNASSQYLTATSTNTANTTMNTNGVSVITVNHITGTNSSVNSLGVAWNAGFEIGRLHSTNWGLVTSAWNFSVVTTSPTITGYTSSASPAPSTANVSYVTHGSWGGNVTPSRFRSNGVDATASANSGSSMRVGTSTASYHTGYMMEAVVYLANQFTNRAGIESNINSYYTIY